MADPQGSRAIAGGLLLILIGVISSIVTVIITVAILWISAQHEQGTQDVILSTRFSQDCLRFRDEGKRPPVCDEVNERVDTLARNVIPPDLRPRE